MSRRCARLSRRCGHATKQRAGMLSAVLKGSNESGFAFDPGGPSSLLAGTVDSSAGFNSPTRRWPECQSNSLGQVLRQIVSVAYRRFLVFLERLISKSSSGSRVFISRAKEGRQHDVLRSGKTANQQPRSIPPVSVIWRTRAGRCRVYPATNITERRA